MDDLALDVPDIPVLLNGRAAGVSRFGDTVRVWFDIPFDAAQGVAIRDLPFVHGEASVELTIGDNTVHGFAFALGEPNAAEVPDVAAIEALDVAPLPVRLGLLDTTSRACAQRDELTMDHVVRFGERDVARWVRLGDDAPHAIGLDADDVLAALLCRTHVPVPVVRPVTLRVDRGGSSVAFGTRRAMVGTDARFDPDAMSAEELSAFVQPPEPDEEPVKGWEAIDGFDVEDRIAFADGDRLTMVEVAAEPGDVNVPDAQHVAEAFTGEIEWPTPSPRAIVDVVDSATARIHVVLCDARATEWTQLDNLLVGHSGARILELVVPRAEHMPQDMPMWGEPGVDHEAMMDEHHRQAALQLERDFERTRAFVAAPTFPVYGPVAEPEELEPLLETNTSTFGGELVRHVVIRWADHFAMFDPERAATLQASPRLEVAASTEPSPFDLPGMDHPEHGLWIATNTAGAASSEPSDPERFHEQVMARARELEQHWQEESVLIDGQRHPAQVVRSGDAYVARIERDGTYITVRSAGLGVEIPELYCMRELNHAFENFVTWRERLDALMRDAQPASATMPPDVAELYDAAERIARALAQAGAAWGDAPASLADVHTSSLVQLAGGQVDFDARTRLVCGAVTSISARPIALDRDGTVACMRVDVSLPQPDGSGASMVVSIVGDELYEHDAHEVRELAAHHPDREQLPAHRLHVHALVARQPDGAFLLETDVIGLIVELAGGVEAILAPQR